MDSKKKNSAFGNYIFAFITALLYSNFDHPNTSPLNLFGGIIDSITSIRSFLFFMANTLGVLAVPAFFAFIYSIFKKRGFSNILAWLTFIICFWNFMSRNF